MVAALLASALAAVVAVALSLPLRSPDDALFNSATVAIGALLAGAGSGVAWWLLGRGAHRVRRFEVAGAVGFVLVGAAVLAANRQLERMASFGLPLAAVVFATIGVLTPVLAGRPLRGWWVGAAIVPVLALGAGLAQVGDEQSSSLALPDPPATTRSAATPGAASPSSAAAAPARSFRTPADVRGVTFVVGEGSESLFTVREQLVGVPLPSDANVRNTSLSGEVHLDGRPSTIQIDLRQFSSDQSRRDAFVRRMFSAQPIATVTVDSIGTLPERYTPGDVVKRQVAGRLQILNFVGAITFNVEARIDGEQLFILGRTTFKWADFQIPPPNVAGIVQVEDEVRAEVLLATRAKAG